MFIFNRILVHTRYLLSWRVLSRTFYLFASIHQKNRPTNKWRVPKAEVRFLAQSS